LIFPFFFMSHGHVFLFVFLYHQIINKKGDARLQLQLGDNWSEIKYQKDQQQRSYYRYINMTLICILASCYTILSSDTYVHKQSSAQLSVRSLV
jgi:hypothetical protein